MTRFAKIVLVGILALVAVQTTAIVYFVVVFELLRFGLSFGSASGLPGDPDYPGEITVEAVVSESPITTVATGVGSDTAVVSIIEEGLYWVQAHLTRDDAPTDWGWRVKLKSVSEFGQLSWSGTSWRTIHVYADEPRSSPYAYKVAVIAPGEIKVQTNAPPGNPWAVSFEPYAGPPIQPGDVR